MYRKVCSTLLSISLVVPFFSSAAPVLAASAEEKPSSMAVNFEDMNGHWANLAVAKFAQAGIVTGYDDQEFHPDEPVTRAEFVTFLNRVFRYESDGPLSFTDVKPSDWYKDAISKATNAGLIQGYPDGRFLPNERIQRQDAVLLLTRAFQISSRTNDSMSRFHDAAEIDDYAKSAMSSLISEGYLTGDDGQNLQPKRAMTRAETVELLGRMIGWMSPDFGDAKTKEIKGNVIVNKPGTTLQDVEIDGNLYVTEGVGEGEVTFSNITVAGDTFIKGGGVHSVIFNKSQLSRVAVNKKNNLVRVALNDSSSANTIEVNYPSIVELASGSKVKEVQIGETAHGSKVVNKGTIDRLKVGAEGVTVNDQPVKKGDDLNLPETPKTDVPGALPSSSSSSSNSSPADPWQLVWSDEFNDSTVNTSKWNVQDTGTVYNNELEYYSPNNVSISKDGDKNVLVLEAKKESHSGRNYTSGKLTSQMKGDWTYGKFEVRAKLPIQQGMWPAIWMMPTDDQKQYGPWPGSGEMDIMELTGPVATDPSNADVYPRRVQGTIHYDVPHAQQSNQYLLPQGQTFADDYHVFSLEWLPGKISYLVDGHKYFETSDWGTKGDGQAEYYTYPAPFDRPFYMILNLAVGGDMPGNPKDDFKSDKMYVDYVRAYKYKDLDKLPDVTGKRPDSSSLTVPQRDPMPDGNQIWNNKFDGGTDNSGVPLNWQFLKNVNGDGNVSIVDDPVKGKVAKVTVTNAGDQLYSIQLTQMPLMLEKGKAYKVTYDAKADAPRTIMSKLTQYQGSWTPYSGEVTAQLTDQWQSYEYSFNMKSKTDNNARFEFNLGKTSTASVYFTNVKVVEIPWIQEPQEERKPLSDGNLIFNGGFDQGMSRMAFWNLTSTSGANAAASVSNVLVPSTYMMDRKLSVTMANNGTSPESVVLSQSGLVLSKGAVYTLTFDAKADHNRSIAVGLDTGVNGGVTYAGGPTVNLTDTMTTYTKHFTVNDTNTNTDSTLKYLLGGDTGTVVMDNVRLIKRNDPPTVNDYVHIPADQYWEMQGTTLVASGEGGKEVTGMDPGNYADYKISVAQPGRYVPSVRVSSVKDDSVLNFTVLDESLHAVKVTSVTVGNTGDGQSDKTIYIEPFDLETGTYYLRLTGQDYDTVWIDFSREMIQNGDFSSNDTNGWTLLKNSGDPGVQAASMSAANGELGVNIGGPGVNEWDVQVKQTVNKALMNGKTYRLSFDASASIPRDIKGMVQFNGAPYTNYMDQTVSLATYKQHFEKVFTMTADNPDSVFQFSLGKIGDISVSHSVYLDNVSLVQIMSQKANLIPNGDFSSGILGWTIFSQDTGQLAISNDNGSLRADVGTVGTESWHRQVYYEGIGYKNGNQYTLSFKAHSTIPRKMNISVGWSDDAAHNYAWHGYGSKIIDLGTTDQTYTFTFIDDKDTTDKGRVSFELGNIEGGNAGNLSVFIDDIVQVNDGAITP